jgi:hypothetical protein
MDFMNNNFCDKKWYLDVGASEHVIEKKSCRLVNFVNFQKDVFPKACCIFGFVFHHHISFFSHI